ncbi:MAG: hypothetical protein ACI4W6_02895 [Acutalibacteraceae bacterium]
MHGDLIIFIYSTKYRTKCKDFLKNLFRQGEKSFQLRCEEKSAKKEKSFLPSFFSKKLVGVGNAHRTYAVGTARQAPLAYAHAAGTARMLTREKISRL